MARLRSLLLDTIGDEGLVRIIRAMAAQAEAGDVAAATLLLRYLLGMPGDAPNPDRLDHDQFDIINTSPLTRMLAMVQESADPAGTRQKALKILEELKQRDQEELKQRE